jgi:hypothetical protein
MEHPAVDPTLSREALRPEAFLPSRWAARRAMAATLHRLPERMLVDRAKGEAAALRRHVAPVSQSN